MQRVLNSVFFDYNQVGNAGGITITNSTSRYIYIYIFKKKSIFKNLLILLVNDIANKNIPYFVAFKVLQCPMAISNLNLHIGFTRIKVSIF